MLRGFKMSMTLCMASWLSVVPAHAAAAAASLTPEEAHQIGVEAYTYAYPLVLMEVTRRVASNVVQPDPQRLRAPMGQFAHAPKYPDATFKDVVRPNADTLYSMLWFDVGKEPLVFSMPDTGGRYYVLPIMDMWTDVFATLGSRTTGTGANEFVLVGPHWKGETPAGMRVIVSPTNTGWVINRIQTNGADDYDYVHKLQAGFKAVPLSEQGKAFTPAPGVVDPAIDMKTPPVQQVAKMTPDAFFSLFAKLIRTNPPHAADYATLMRLERLGIVPGKDFVLADAPPVVRDALTRAAPDALARMMERGPQLRPRRDGWVVSTVPLGVYGNNYLLRAYIAFGGLGALPNEDAIYPSTATSADGKPLTGENRYVLHFDKSQLPPAGAFWSLTMYGADQFFVDNPINRYAIGDRDKLTYNPDGSLDLYLQHQSPGKDKESNWLPAPQGRFTMNLRVYLPSVEALDGRWGPSAVQRVPD
ncbi:MAG: DUF1254 domain-containing protein [Burkholderiaceae bacterium]